MSATNKQQVKRVTVSGLTEIQFDRYCGKYLVKNYSAGDIYVSFKENATTADSIRIASNMGQLCEINEQGGLNGQDKADSIFVISGAGEVEVQQLWW